MLSVSNLTYYRNESPVFSDVSFSLAAGEILHIAGANGSGKTTLLCHLIGVLKPQAGEICWQNNPLGDANDYFSQLAFLGHKQGLKAALTVKENLSLAAQLADAPGGKDLDSVLEELGLKSLRQLLCRQLSAGQKQRMALARLLLLPKLVWILDEPFTAIDQGGVTLLTELLTKQLQRGGLVILTSHQSFALPGMSVKQLHMVARP